MKALLRVILVLSIGFYGFTSHGLGIDQDGNILNWKPPIPQPCYGADCYAKCQQAYDSMNNVSGAAHQCLTSCFTAEGPIYPGAFMQSCMACADEDVQCAIQVGVYTSCKAVGDLDLTNTVGDAVIEVTGCAEMPSCCGDGLRAVASGLEAVMGERVEVLSTPQVLEAYLERQGKKDGQKGGKK